jgi:hypothetical protein
LCEPFFFAKWESMVMSPALPRLTLLMFRKFESNWNWSPNMNPWFRAYEFNSFRSLRMMVCMMNKFVWMALLSLSEDAFKNRAYDSEKTGFDMALLVRDQMRISVTPLARRRPETSLVLATPCLFFLSPRTASVVMGEEDVQRAG